MKQIVTLTLNPCVDGACETDQVKPTHKIRTTGERYDPGGGGINVARVVTEMGGDAKAVYLSGGATGVLLDQLLIERNLPAQPVHIADLTRISHAVYERSSGREYRFVPEGPLVAEAEWDECLTTLKSMDFAYLVDSGSRPRGLPDHNYGDLADLAARKGARYVLDTSGPALGKAIESGDVFLAKPSLGELRGLTGKALETLDEIGQCAQDIVRQGRIELLAVTMGHEGALLAHADGTYHLCPPEVPVRSAVGAGDSFLGAMVHGLSTGKSPEDAFRLGIAAGTAAVITPGTELCQRKDVLDLYQSLAQESETAV